jgi:uncharacterized membrane protein
MRVETNTQLVKRNKRTANILFFVSLAILMSGFLTANLQLSAQDDTALTLSLIIPWIILPLGLLTTIASVRMTNQWVRRPRPEEALQQGLKGLSKRSVLYNYYHGPARHVLITPQGIFAIVTRFQDGSFSVEGDRWKSGKGVSSRIMRFFRQDDIGNPSAEARAAAEHIKSLLATGAPDVEVNPLVVFIDPRAQVEAINPAVPVLYADENREPNLRDYLRQLSQQPEEEPTQSGRKKKTDRSKTDIKQSSGFNPEAVADALEEATIL